MCSGIQFLCELSTVIYTSVAILHWWFCATVKYPYGITRCRKFFNEKELTHEMQLTSVCLFMVRICPSVCLVVTRGYSGRIWSVAGVFCFHIPFLQAVCSRSVYMDLWWHAAWRQFRYQQGYCLTWYCCSLRTRGIFANGAGALRMPAILNPYPHE